MFVIDAILMYLKFMLSVSSVWLFFDMIVIHTFLSFYCFVAQFMSIDNAQKIS